MCDKLRVIDDMHGRGIGSLLLDHLIDAARRNGIDVFRSWALAENRTVIEGLQALGADLEYVDGLIRIDLDLPERFQGSNLEQALRASAEGRMPVEPRR